MNNQNKAEHKNDDLSLRQNELIQKQTKLQVYVDLVKASSADLERKNNALKEETKKLDKLQQKVWSLQNRMCEDVWNFSNNHKIMTIFNTFPRLPHDCNLNCECKDTRQREGQIPSEMQNMSLEIEALELDLEYEQFNEFQNDLNKAEMELQECKKKSPEIQSLENDIEECKRRIANLQAKIQQRMYNSTDNHTSLFGNNSVNSLQSSNTCTVQPLKSAILPKSNVKRKLDDLNSEQRNNDLTFVKASTYMKNMESQMQSKVTSEKSGPAVATVQPRKKFVCKTKSLIARKLVG